MMIRRNNNNNNNNTRHRRRRQQRLILYLLILLQYLTLTESFLKKLFNFRRGRIDAKRKSAEEIARRIQRIDLGGGFEIDKTTFFVSLTVVICLSFGVLSHIASFSSWLYPRKKGGNRPNVDGTVDVIVVGVGLPKKGMGWYHLQQLLTLPTVNVKAIIEPFYLNPKLHPPNNPPPRSWKKFLKATTALGIECYSTINDLSPFTKPTLCLIAGRTMDNPKFFHQCIDKGASTIYLEKPGATSVDELIRMKDYADARHVKVYMGYNKHVAPYIQKAVTLAHSLPNAQVSFIHNNDYREADLPEVFSRNPEGMLKNMAIHELAILVTFFNVTRDNIDHFLVNKNKKYTEKKTVVWESPHHAIISSDHSSSVNRTATAAAAKATNGSSSCNSQQPHNNKNNNSLESRKQQRRRWQPRWKQSWQKQQQHQHQQSKTSITDYSRVAFKITTTTGTIVSISANRCTDTPSSTAIVKDVSSDNDQEIIKSFHCPDDDTLIKLKNRQKQDPEMMSYFFLQSDDYWELKKRVVDAMIWGGRAKDVATIEEGIEALKLAEYANEQLEKMLI